MALILNNRIKETASAPGTSAVSLGGAVSQFRTFASKLANGDTTYYEINDGQGAWEIGIGTWNTGNTLSRTTLLDSSTGIAINFTNAVTVWCDMPSQRSVYLDAAGGLRATTQSPGDNSTLVATDAFVTAALGAYVPSINNANWSGAALTAPNGGTGATSFSQARDASHLNVPQRDGTDATGSSWPISITGRANVATTLDSGSSYTAANFILSSDDKLKDRQGNIDGALVKLCFLDGFYFTFNDKSAVKDGRVRMGLSAQRVQEFFPEAIYPIEQDGQEYLGVDYTMLIPALIEALKDTRRENEARALMYAELKADILKLQGR